MHPSLPPLERLLGATRERENDRRLRKLYLRAWQSERRKLYLRAWQSERRKLYLRAWQSERRKLYLRTWQSERRKLYPDKHAMNIARALDGQNLQYRKDKFRMSLRVPFHFVLSTLTANIKTSLHHASILFQGSATHAKPGSTHVFSHSSADRELTYMFWHFYTQAEPLTAIEMSSDAIQITNLPAEQRIHQEPAVLRRSSDSPSKQSRS